jgi:hypothetical protein
MPGIPPPSPVSPWHMWGTSLAINATATAGTITRQTGQLARINYRRPENWRFFLAGRLTGGDQLLGSGGLYTLKFFVWLGVGRSIYQTGYPNRSDDEFAFLAWSVPINGFPGQQQNNQKYLTSTLSPPLDDVVGATSRLPIDHVVAQDLQCSCEFSIIAAPPGTHVTCEATAYFAPNVHVRPDWFQPEAEPGPYGDPVAEGARAMRFTGSETGGT